MKIKMNYENVKYVKWRKSVSMILSNNKNNNNNKSE